MKLTPQLVRRTAVMCTIALFGAGCSSNPQHNVASNPSTISQSQDSRKTVPIGARAADIAARQVGAPYRWGGNSPSGFDCSGLVHYSYAQVGIAVPRTTRDQRSAMRRVDISEVEPGDLLFFNTQRKGWHVALYLGHDQFVHAPSTGKTVTVGSLNNAYYRDHLVDVRQAVAR